MHVFPVPHTERHVTVDLKQFYTYSQFLGTYMYVYTYRYAYVCMYLCMYLCVCVMCVCMYMVSQVVLMLKKLSANAGDARDTDSVSGLGRSPGGGNGNRFQYSCLINPMDIGAWWAAVQRVSKSGTQMSSYAKNLSGSCEFALAPFPS